MLPIVPLFVRKFFARAFNNGELVDSTMLGSLDSQVADLAEGHNQVRSRLNAISTSAGSLRYALVSLNTAVATASQTAFTVTTYDSTAGASFVIAFSGTALIPPASVAQTSTTVVTIPAQTVGTAVTIAIFGAGNGTSQLASTSSGQGASLIGINDAGSLLVATEVEAALQEIATNLASSTYVAGIIGLANYIKKDGTVTFTANQSMGSHKITNLSAGTAASNDAARMNDITPAALQSALGTFLSTTYVPLAGNVTMTGPLDFGSTQRITNLPQATASGHPLTYDQLPTANSFRNSIINGGAIVANGSDYVSSVSGTYNYGKSELCKGALTGTTVAGTLTQNTASSLGRTGCSFYWSAVTTTGSGVAIWRFYIEAKDALRFKNQNATVSLQARHSVGSPISFGINVYKPTVVDNFTALTTISTGAAQSVTSDTNTALYNRAIAMGDCSNGVLVEVTAGIGAVTNKGMEITEAQIEVGAVETAFEYEPVTAIEDRVLRYYEKMAGDFAGQDVAVGQCTSTTVSALFRPYLRRKRASPTCNYTGSIGNFVQSKADGTTQALNGLVLASVPDGVAMTATAAAATLVAGNATVLLSNNTANYFTVDARF